jgi:hypothetical protein
MSWSAAENSEENFSKEDDEENSFEREERHQISENVDDMDMDANALNNTLQKSSRTDHDEIVQTAETIIVNVSTDPVKNKPILVKSNKKKTKKSKNRKKVQSKNVWKTRLNFLEGSYASVQEESDKAGVLCNLSLRTAASNVGLSILRSSNVSISFYPMGLSKRGNTVCTFSTTKRNPLWWTCTKNDLNQVMTNWEKISPSGTPTARRKPVQWKEAGTCHV